jgi:hypothetical protein
MTERVMGGVGGGDAAGRGLAQLRLPASLETLDAPHTVPELVLRHADEVRTGGGIRALSDLNVRVRDGAHRCGALINQVRSRS